MYTCIMYIRVPVDIMSTTHCGWQLKPFWFEYVYVPRVRGAPGLCPLYAIYINARLTDISQLINMYTYGILLAVKNLDSTYSEAKRP